MKVREKLIEPIDHCALCFTVTPAGLDRLLHEVQRRSIVAKVCDFPSPQNWTYLPTEHVTLNDDEVQSHKCDGQDDRYGEGDKRHREPRVLASNDRVEGCGGLAPSLQPQTG